MQRTNIVWFRRDLRVGDHPALYTAKKAGTVVPVYVEQEGVGTAMCTWRQSQLALLKKDLPNLQIVKGKPEVVLKQLATKHKAGAVYYNKHYWPQELKESARVDAALSTESFYGDHLVEPGESSYKVFTPFYKWVLKVIEIPKPLPGGIQSEAKRRLTAFLGHVDRYTQEHDLPSVGGTSGLSPYMAVGAISPRQVWHAAKGKKGADPFLRQVMWREFCYQLLHQFPELSSQPFKPAFAKFPWRKDPKGLRRWQQGETGYPIVDAGMRQLAETGWMHNRVRLIVASFLTKHLLIPWWEGEAWFWEHLIDADLAANAFNWQWVAGSGADAAPYFRIFNPILQGKKFDRDGAYVRYWVPELKDVPDACIHSPWESEPVKGYPGPIVDHAAARDRALKAYERVKRA